MMALTRSSFAVAQAKKPVLIGLTSDASGTYAPDGADERRGMLMAIEEFNEKGGVLGRKIEYKHEDTETNPSTAARKAERLIQREQVDFLVGACSSACANAISEIAQRSGVIFFNSNSSADSVSNENCHRTNFVVDANNHMFIYGLGPWVARNLGKRWYFLTHDYTFGKSGTAEFRKILTAEKGDDVGEVLIPMGTRDFSAQIIKILAAKPDVVMMTIAGDDAISLYTQVKEFGADKKVQWCTTLKDWPVVWDLGWDKNFGVFGVSWYHKLDAPGVKEFVARYKKRWPNASVPVPGNESYNGYMSVRELLRAVERAGTTRNHEVIKALEGWVIKDSMKHDPTTIRALDHVFQQTMYVARQKPKDKMEDETDLHEIIGVTKPEEAVVKPADSMCKMETYAATPVYWRQ
jgi:branched-chain amino acid transport system substrate-binding protein